MARNIKQCQYFTLTGLLEISSDFIEAVGNGADRVLATGATVDFVPLADFFRLGPPATTLSRISSSSPGSNGSDSCCVMPADCKHTKHHL